MFFAVNKSNINILTMPQTTKESNIREQIQYDRETADNYVCIYIYISLRFKWLFLWADSKNIHKTEWKKLTKFIELCKVFFPSRFDENIMDKRYLRQNMHHILSLAQQELFAEIVWFFHITIGNSLIQPLPSALQILKKIDNGLEILTLLTNYKVERQFYYCWNIYTLAITIKY